MKKVAVVFLAALLLTGCRVGSGTEGYTGLTEVSLSPAETVLAQEAETTEENEATGEGDSTEETVRELPRVYGEEVFGLVFFLRDGGKPKCNFAFTNAEGQVVRVIDGRPYGEIDLRIGFISGSPGLLNCAVPYTDSFTLDVDYTQEDNSMTTWLSYWYYGTAPCISGSNIRQVAFSKDEVRVLGDNMQDYEVRARNLDAEVPSYEDLPILQVTGTDESEIWLTGLAEKNQVEIHTETSGYTVRIVLDKGPEQVALEQTFQPGQVAVVNYNPGEFSITLKEP